MLRLRLYWKRNDEDVDLGVCYHDVLPPLGSLISHTTEAHERSTWRVTVIYLQPAQEGSIPVCAVEMGRPDAPGRIGMVMLFVEPAAGPFG